MDYIIRELQRCAGTQFDPLVADTAVKILKEIESMKITDRAVKYANQQQQNSSAHLQTFDAH
jgi:hypothetical protein